MNAGQLDLFAVAPAVTPRRPLAASSTDIAEGLTCLRDAVAEALELVVRLPAPVSIDHRAPSVSGDWAYCDSPDGLRFERRIKWPDDGARNRGETWDWDRAPRHLLTWVDLAALIDGDPRHREITAWADGLPQPRYPVIHRPHELWMNPLHWDRGRIAEDHARAGWPARLHAWHTLLKMLTDAIEGVRHAAG